jgi:hypothetical protein
MREGKKEEKRKDLVKETGKEKARKMSNGR